MATNSTIPEVDLLYERFMHGFNEGLSLTASVNPDENSAPYKAALKPAGYRIRARLFSTIVTE